MPIEFKIDHDRHIVIAKPYGKLSPEEMMQYQQQVWGKGDVAGYDELVDMNAVKEVAADTINNVQQLAAVATATDPKVGPSKLAIVATNDYHHGMGRMYKFIRENHPGSAKVIEVFRAYEDAVAWLTGNRE